MKNISSKKRIFILTFKLSSKLEVAGLIHAIIKVLEFPPKESDNKRVNLESLYGICLVFLFLSPSAEMTFPRAKSPELMLIP